jgi:glycosyltransferase involved in cell wall biosynthesis
MLSICLPIYNYDVRPLVRTLLRHAQTLTVAYEIILLDDGSEERFKYKNSELGVLPNVRYIETGENVGRSTIRNLLAAAAQYDYLIFLDCDAEIPHKTFLTNYLAACKGEHTVVYGGRLYAPVPEQKAWFFRWKYGIARECASAAARNRYPNRSFISFNFMIAKSLLRSIGFDETLKGYGHEDTLLGYELSKRGVVVQHIDNAVWHIGLEDSFSFVEKTENGIKNLLKLQKKLHYPPQLTEDIKLLAYFEKMKRWRLISIIKKIFSIFKPFLLKNLHSHNPNLTVFDAYKLGFICSVD